MIAKRLYLLSVEGQLLETFSSIPLLWDYLTVHRLNGDLSYQQLERLLDTSERFEFDRYGRPYAVKLDHPNRSMEVLQWMGIG